MVENAFATDDSTGACPYIHPEITSVAMISTDSSARLRVLSTPELLDNIFVSCTRKMNVSLALVCRTWLGPAQDHIWRVVETPCQLFRILAPVNCPGKAHQANGHVRLLYGLPTWICADPVVDYRAYSHQSRLAALQTHRVARARAPSELSE